MATDNPFDFKPDAAYPEPDDDAIGMLKSGKSDPATSKFFEEVYGPGSARKFMDLGESPLAKKAQEDGTLEAADVELRVRERIRQMKDAEEAKYAQSPGLFGDWGQLDDAGKAEWIKRERADADEAIGIWQGLRKGLTPERVEADPTIASMGRDPSLQALESRYRRSGAEMMLWANRKAEAEEKRHAQRKVLADAMEAGEREAARFGPARARVDDVLRGTFDLVGNMLKGFGNVTEYGASFVSKEHGLSKVEENLFWQMGQFVEAKAHEAFPKDKARSEEFATALSEGAGSMAGFLGPTVAAKLIANAGPKTLTAISATSGSLSQAEMVDEMRMYLGAKAEIVGKDDPDAEMKLTRVWLMSLGIGATEAVPIATLLSRTEGRLTKRVLLQMVEEGGQEWVQQVLENVVAQNNYDPFRTWDDGAWQGAAIGAILGAKTQLAVEGYRAYTAKPEEPKDDGVPKAPGDLTPPALEEPTPDFPGMAGPGAPTTSKITGQTSDKKGRPKSRLGTGLEDLAATDQGGRDAVNKTAGIIEREIPEFADVMKVLPRDEAGDPDISTLFTRLQEYGVQTWGKLSDEQKQAIYRVFAPETSAAAPQEGADGQTRAPAPDGAPEAGAAPGAPQAAPAEAGNLRESFAKVINSKGSIPKFLEGVEEGQRQALVDQAVKDGLLKISRGRPIRTGKRAEFANENVRAVATLSTKAMAAKRKPDAAPPAAPGKESGQETGQPVGQTPTVQPATGQPASPSSKRTDGPKRWKMEDRAKALGVRGWRLMGDAELRSAVDDAERSAPAPPPAMDRATENRIAAAKSPVARDYARKLAESADPVAYGNLAKRLSSDRRVTKAIAGEVYQAITGNKPGKLSKKDMLAEVAARMEPETPPAAAAPKAPPVEVVTPDNTMRVEATPEIVDLATLTAASGALQPRDRSRAESDVAIRQIAANLDPQQLMPSRVSDAGAPIVSAGGTVVSGNGRIAAIRMAYQDPALKAQADAYRAALGPEAAGMTAPVMVMRLPATMGEPDLVRFADLSNRSRIASMSATERAMRDARAAGPEIMGLYTGGSFTSAENRPFYRAFMEAAVTSSERGSLSRDGVLTKEGEDRLSAAVLAAAYGDADLLARMLESTDDNIKSVTGAMRDAAGAIVRMKEGIRQGGASAQFDITPHIVETAKRIGDLRDRNIKPDAFLAQQDAFNQVDPMVEALLRAFYNDNLSRTLSREKLTELLIRYAEEAVKHQDGGLFADETKPTDILTGARDRVLAGDRSAATQGNLFDRKPVVAGGPAPGDGAEGRRQGDAGRGQAAGQVAGGLDVSGRSPGLEPDWRDGPPQDGLGQADVPAARGPDGEGVGPGGEAADADGRGGRGVGLPQDDAAAVGAGRDSALQGGTPGVGGRAARGQRRGRGRDAGVGGPAPDAGATGAAAQVAVDASPLARAVAAQAAAEDIPVVENDPENIRATLPLLKPAQQTDVVKAEARFSQPDGHGFLFTNGTGTGKTFSALGIIKRFVRTGRSNILILAPSQGILDGWVMSARMFGLDITRLPDTASAGTGVVATTYANLRENRALADRDWDLIVADEAHHLSQNASGNPSDALNVFRGLSGHSPFWRARVKLSEEAATVEALELQAKSDPRVKPDADAARTAYSVRLMEVQREYETRPRSKALFLSATPFAYRKNTDWAEGFLFNYPEASNRYGTPGGRDAFLVRNFGYGFRYNRAEEPGPEVNVGVLEREFYEQLKKQGVLSGRRLEVEADYDRRFVLVDDAIGAKIDQAFDWLHSEGGGRYVPLADKLREKFNYLAQRRLLEAIKAKHVIPRIKRDLELGRKVVVFHDYNEGGGLDAFGPPDNPNERVRAPYGEKAPTMGELYHEFIRANPYVRKLNFAQFKSPIETLTEAFPEALVYNGRVPNKQRAFARDEFNRDGSGRDLIIVQSAAGEAGISLHDTTGKHQRILYNLGLPTRPTTAIQQEGRIYREGQVSDAILRYMSTGTGWERTAFAQTIAERASTAENLALGDEARALRDAIIDAFNEADAIEQGAKEGKGGKSRDRFQASLVTPFEKAKAFYFGEAKKRGRRDQREGADYYATPEPIGFKMVEFADVQNGEKVLEPSAGHGAIARWFPEGANRTLIEPSPTLSSRAGLSSPGAKILGERFEDHYIGNKYDAIVMNPPFGHGGKTAIEHVAKAAGHIRNGGRIVAIIPRGPSADAKYEAFLKDTPNIYPAMDIEMPGVMFERAGTKVATRLVVLERHDNPETAPTPLRRDLSNAEAIGELFDRIEQLTIKPRKRGAELTPAPAAPRPVRAPTLDIPAVNQPAAPEPAAPPAAPAPQAAVPEAAPQPEPAPPALSGQASAPVRSGPGHKFRMGETKHGKTGEDLFVASFVDYVPRDAYEKVLKVAKKHGGYYSAFRGSGAIPGFQFRAEDARSAFLQEVGPPPAKSAAQSEREAYARREAAARAIMATPEWISATIPDLSRDTSKQPGFWTPEWKAARTYTTPSGEITGYDNGVQYLVDEAVAKIPGGQKMERKVFVLLGFPGAGKSTIAAGIRERHGAAHLVGDDAKLIIPEYDGGKNSGGVHEEASAMGKDVVQRMVAAGGNIIVEKLGSSNGSVMKMVDDFVAAGYEVNVVHVNVPLALAMERAIARWRRRGRAVPQPMFAETASNLPQLMPILEGEEKVHETAEVTFNERTGRFEVVEAGVSIEGLWPRAGAPQGNLGMGAVDRGPVSAGGDSRGLGGQSQAGSEVGNRGAKAPRSVSSPVEQALDKVDPPALAVGQERAMEAARRQLLAGQTVTATDESRRAVRDVMKRLPGIVPEGTRVGSLIRASRDAQGKIRATYETADGELFGLVFAGNDFFRTRAVYVPSKGGVPQIAFNRFHSADALGDLDRTVTRELWHEAIHALRQFRLLDDARFTVLVNHAMSLRVLETPFASYLRAIGDPSFVDTPTNVTIAEMYLDAYAGRGKAQLREAMNQEAVAHMVELYAMGVDLPMPDEVRDILAEIETGALAGRTEGLAPGAPRLFAPTVEEELLAAMESGELRLTPTENPPPVEGFAMPAGPLFAIRAYHGSPHDFDRFDMSKIGTGEGAQAYGHGLYFADSPDVARTYRDQLSDYSNVVTWKGAQPPTAAQKRIIDQLSGFDVVRNRAPDLASVRTDITRQINRERMSEGMPGWDAERSARRVAQLQDELATLDGMKGLIETRAPGRLYEVNIKANPEDFLDWDKPLKEQGDVGRKAALVAGPIQDDADPLLMRGHWRLSDLMEKVRDRGGSREEVAKALRQAGIPGVKYLDQGSRAAGEGSYNYVVFDESLVEIVAKDGQPVAPEVTDQILFALGGTPSIGASQRRDLDALGYYSKALEAARGLKQAKGTPEQMLAQLKAAGVKDAEIEATGLRSVLDGRSTITRDEIVRHLEENRVGLREVVRRADRGVPLDLEALENVTQMYHGYGYEEASADIQRQMRQELGMEAVSETKWSRHSLDEDNPTYRETVLHLPSAKPDFEAFRAESLANGVPETEIKRNYQRLMNDPARMAREDSTNFTAGHFPELNIVGHMQTSMVRLPAKARFTKAEIADIGERMAKAVGAKRVEDMASGAVNTAVNRGAVTEAEARAFASAKGWATARDSAVPDQGEPAYLIDQIQGDWYDAYIESIRNAVAEKMHGKKWGRLAKDQKEAVSAEIGAMRQRGETPPGVKDEAKIAELRKRVADQRAKADAYIMGEPAKFVQSIYGGAFQNVTVPNVTRYLDELQRRERPNTPMLTPEQMAQLGIYRGTIEDLVQPMRLMEAELRTAEAAAPPPHPLAATLDQYLNTILRRAIRQAAEADAKYIAIPSGDTVLSYNPGDENGMRQFYGHVAGPDEIARWQREAARRRADGNEDGAKEIEGSSAQNARIEGIVPKNLRKLLEKIDKDSAKPIKIATLDSPSGKTGLGKGFTLFPLTDKVKAEVMEMGQPMFALGGMPRGLTVDEKIENIKAIDKKIAAMPSVDGPERRVALTDDFDLVIYRSIKHAIYDVVKSGEKLWDVNGNSTAVGSFQARASQRMDATGVEVTNARLRENLQRKGIGSKVYDIVEADFADVGGVVPSPDDQQSPAAKAFWNKRLKARGQRGAALDMSPEARKQRAEEMNFDTSRVWYRGGQSARDELRAVESEVKFPAVWFSSSPEVASEYAEMRAAYANMAEAPRPGREDRFFPSVTPVYVRGQMKRVEGLFRVLSYERMAEHLANAKEEGYDGVLFKRIHDRPGATGLSVRKSTDVLAIFSPSNIRSVNAAFDPAEDGSPQLMAALSGSREPQKGSLSDIIAQLKDAVGMTTTQGLYGMTVSAGGWRQRINPASWIRGQYDNRSGVARMRSVRDIEATAHEGAHHLERLLGQEMRQLQKNHELELDFLTIPGTVQTTSERFAEWFRMYVTNPGASKTAAPRLYEAFEDLVDAEMPGMLEKLHEVQDVYEQYQMRSPLDQVAGDLVATKARGIVGRAIGSYRDGTLATDIKVALANAYTGVIDQLNPIWHLQRSLLDIADSNGVTGTDGKPIRLRPWDSPYIKMRSFAGSFKRGHNWLVKGVIDPNSSAAIAPSLREALTRAFGGTRGRQWDDKTYQDFNAYLMSRVSLERYRQFEEKQAKLQEINQALEEAAVARRRLSDQATKDEARLERRKLAAERNRALMQDRRRLAETEGTQAEGIQQQLQDQRDDVLAAQMARDRALADRRGRREDILADRGRQQDKRADQAEIERDTYEVQAAAIEAEIAQLQEAADGSRARVDELDGYVAELRRQRDAEYGSGLHRPPVHETKDKLQAVVAEADGKYPQFAEAARIFHAYAHGLLTLEHRAGYLTDEEFARLSEQRMWYAPLMRDMSDIPEARVGVGSDGRKYQAHKKFGGSDRAVINPVDIIIERSYQLSRKMAFNDAVRTLVDLVRMVGPGAGIIAEEVTREETLAANQASFDRIAATAQAMGLTPDETKNLVTTMEHMTTASDMHLLMSPSGKGAKPALMIPYWEGGERKQLRINDPDYAEEIFNAYNGLGAEMHNIFVRMMATPSRMLSFGVTAHPAFALVNLMRDAMAAWVYTGAAPVWTQMKGLGMELATWSGFQSATFKNNAPLWIKRKLEESERFVRAYHDAGGIRGGQYVATLADTKDLGEWKDLNREGFALGRTRGALTGIRWPKIWEIIELAETGTRLGVAKRAFDRAKAFDPTISDEQAIQEAVFTARDVMDFDRRGSSIAVVTRIVPFMNPAIQGLDKSYRSMTGQGDRGGALKKRIAIALKHQTGVRMTEQENRDLVEAYKALGRVLTLNAMFTALWFFAYKDDPEEEEINPRIKNTHAPVKIMGEWYRIPKPFDLAVPSTVTNEIIRAYGKDDPALMGRLYDAVADVMAPPVVPQIAALTTELAHNYSSFRGRQIVPDRLIKASPEEQYEWYTSEVAKWFGRNLGVSPMKVDHALTNGLGYIGREIQRWGDWSVGVQKPGADTSMVVQRLKADPYKGSMSTGEFYRQYSGEGAGGFIPSWIKGMIAHEGKTYAQAAADYKLTLEAQNPIKAKEKLATYPDEVQAYAYLQGHFNKPYLQLHPMNRLNEVMTIIGGIQKEVVNGDIKVKVRRNKKKNEEVETLIKPTLKEQEQLLDTLARLKTTEARNTFVAMDHGVWKGARPLPVEKVLDELKEAFPNVHEELMNRLDRSKYHNLEDTVAAWQKAKPELLKAQEEADLGEALGLVNTGKPKIGG